MRSSRRSANPSSILQIHPGKELQLGKQSHQTRARHPQEYEDRFLIELIQTGYDVHDAARSDGQIWIHFAKDEGEFGTLYVANGGRPFKESNFHAICEIAQSDKDPGSGIGNKGVGFKSVLHVCDSPEIYSVDGTPRTYPRLMDSALGLH